MVEAGFRFRSMAPIAGFTHVVTGFARRVSNASFRGSLEDLLFLPVAANAAFTCVAGRAFEAKKIDMFVMVECHQLAFLIACLADNFVRLRDHRMNAGFAVFGFFSSNAHRAIASPRMATLTAGIITPPPMAIEALLMVCAFEIGPSEVRSDPAFLMTLIAP